jgi:uncharacterized membrane protein YkoI
MIEKNLRYFMKMKTLLYTLGLALTFSFGSFLSAQDVKINPEDLPTNASSFIKTNFGAEKILMAEKDIDQNETSYEVHLSNGAKIEFDQNGNWKEVDGNKKTSIPTAFIDKNILKFVSANYPNAKIIKIEKDLTKYEVDLSNGKELVFDNAGKYLRLD